MQDTPVNGWVGVEKEGGQEWRTEREEPYDPLFAEPS